MQHHKQKMKTLYLDHNIIIDIKDNRKPDFVQRINNLDKKEYQIFFSPAHIEEIAALKMRHGNNDETVNSFLDQLGNITNSKALLPFERRDTAQRKRGGIYLSEEHPKTTYQRVIEHYENNSIAEEHQKEKISRGEEIQRKTGITSLETNFINIQEEIDRFKPKLHQIIINNYPTLRQSYPGLLRSQAPLCNEINFSYLGKKFPLHEMTIEKIFEFLEARRYYPDKSTQFLSGLHDTTHAIYAAYCDIFITNDNKLKNKTKATYNWLGIKTLVLNPNEFIEHLDNRSID